MASFTDKSPQFNPYIQQLPVEAMTNVGVQKQALYNQGLQRIQSQIDSVAGLDIARDVDKAYLQSKMNSLGNSLKLVAAGDFSDFQLVNSVGGMVNQVGNDENIRNAVSATARYKKGLADMQTAMKEGKSSPSNEYYFKLAANDWFSNNEVGASFNGEYTPYTDIKKSSLEVLKAVTGDTTITEDILGPHGEILDAKVRKVLKGKSPDDIRNALMATFSPKEMKQLEIDGVYSYANLDKDNFGKALGVRYQSTINDYTKKKETLNSKLNSTANGAERDLLTNQIEQIDKALTKINNEYDAIKGKVDSGDIQSAKANLYTIDFINNFANAFSYVDSEVGYAPNPMEMATYRRQKLATDAKKVTQQDEAMFGPMLSGLTREEQDAINVNMERLSGTIKSTEEKLNTGDITLAKEFGEENNPKWIADQYELWRNQNANQDPKIKDHFNSTNDQRKNLEMWRNLAVKIDDEAKSIYGNVKDYLPPEALSTQYRNMDGSIESLSWDEAIALNSKLGSDLLAFMKAEPMNPKQYVGQHFTDEIRSRLNEKEKRIYDQIVRNYMEGVGQPAIANYMVRVNQTLKNNPNVREIFDYKRQRISDALLAYQSTYNDIDITDKKNESAFKSGLTGMIEDAKQQKGGISQSPDFDAKDAQEILDDPNLNATLKVIPGTEFNEPLYRVTITAKGKSQTFDMSKERYQVFMKGRYDVPAEKSQLNRYRSMMAITNSNSTSSDGKKTNAYNAGLDKTDFRGVKYYGITGDLNRVTSGGYSIRLNIYDPVSEKILEDVPYVLPGYDKEIFNDTDVIAAINSLTDDVIFQLLSENHRVATPEEMSNIKTKSLKVYK